LREFLPAPTTIEQVARRLGVSRIQLSRILNGRSAISANMAIRIGRLTNTAPESWLAGQTKWDLWLASQAQRPAVRPLRRVSSDAISRRGDAVRAKLAALGVDANDVRDAVRWSRESGDLPTFTHDDLVK